MTTMCTAAWRNWRSEELAGPGRDGMGTGMGESRPHSGQGCPAVPPRASPRGWWWHGCPQLHESSGGRVLLHFVPPSVFWKVPQLLLGGGESWCFQKQGPLELRLQAEAVCGCLVAQQGWVRGQDQAT